MVLRRWELDEGETCTDTPTTSRTTCGGCAGSKARSAGLQRMVEDDKYCIDILTQVSAATRALQSVALGLLEEHLAHCVAEADRARAAPRPTPRSRRPPTRSPASSAPDRRPYHDAERTHAAPAPTPSRA